MPFSMPQILALEKRINASTEERRALWQRLEAAFKERMLARHTAYAGRCR
jgi:hypothetical protein